MKTRMKITTIMLSALMLGALSGVAAADPEWRNMGPGMMGGYGMGSGMMGGYGPGYGMGPGMMGGYGMGPGMMGGYGRGYGMGPGMMGYGATYRDLNLSADQQAKITEVRKTMRTKHLGLMAQMMDAQEKLQELYDDDKPDAAAINKQYKVLEDLRRQMVDSAVEARNRIDSILTKEQREKARGGGGGYGPMMWGY